MFFLLYGQKSEQANREHKNPVGKHTHFSRVTYFFHIFTSENMENAGNNKYICMYVCMFKSFISSLTPIY